MEFDKKDWKKKFGDFLVDKEYKKDNGNLEIILKAVEVKKESAVSKVLCKCLKGQCNCEKNGHLHI